MGMTSKDVDKLIRAEVWPFVREQGFVVSGRTARRWWTDAIDVINFQSYSDHVAGVHGMTTFSFQVNLSVQPAVLPPEGEVSYDKQGRPLLKEWQCFFRHYVEPSVPKPPRRRSLNPFGHRPLPAPTGTFEIAKDGSNARECVIDARAGIEQQALAWFEARRTTSQMLALLEAENDLLMRDYLHGLAAARAGDTRTARERLQRVLDTGDFGGYGGDEPIRAALDALG